MIAKSIAHCFAARGLRASLLAALAMSLCGVPVLAQHAMNDADKTFVDKAGSGNQAEIEMGKLAAEKAKSPEVKAFGRKMVTDHTMLGQKMKPFATRLGLKEPSLTIAQHAKMTELHALQGDSFDKAYVEAMVKDHHEDLTDFMHERDATKDTALKNTVSAGTDVIRRHTEMIDGIARKMKIDTPSMP